MLTDVVAWAAATEAPSPSPAAAETDSLRLFCAGRAVAVMYWNCTVGAALLGWRLLVPRDVMHISHVLVDALLANVHTVQSQFIVRTRPRSRCRICRIWIFFSHFCIFPILTKLKISMPRLNSHRRPHRPMYENASWHASIRRIRGVFEISQIQDCTFLVVSTSSSESDSFSGTTNLEAAAVLRVRLGVEEEEDSLASLSSSSSSSSSSESLAVP